MVAGDPRHGDDHLIGDGGDAWRHSSWRLRGDVSARLPRKLLAASAAARTPDQTKPAPGPRCGKGHRGRVRADLVNDLSLPLQRFETTPGGPLMRNLFALVLTVLTLLIGGSAVGMIVMLPAAATCQTCGAAMAPIERGSPPRSRRLARLLCEAGRMSTDHCGRIFRRTGSCRCRKVG